MTRTLEELAQRLDETQAELRATRRRARVSGMVAALALGATLLLNIRPVAFAQTPGVSLASLLARLTTDEGSISANASSISANATNITKQQTLTAPLSLSGTDFTFTGVNVHIVSGSGYTDDGTEGEVKNAKLTGLGNLIIGYNASGTGGGSHNLVLGDYNIYASFGGIVAGAGNSASGPYASVTGGNGNQASGDYASISGGYFNLASSTYASVSGGNSNTASGYSASVSGGYGNTASNFYSTITGGTDNTASGQYTSVSGGNGNMAVGEYASITGGAGNDAYGYISSITGGQNNVIGLSTDVGTDSNPTAPGSLASVTGGFGNTASGELASVSGGDGLMQSTELGWAAGSQGSTDYSGNFASP